MLTRKLIEDVARKEALKIKNSGFEGMIYDIFYSAEKDDLCIDTIGNIEQYKECGYEYICDCEILNNGTYTFHLLPTKYINILKSV